MRKVKNISVMLFVSMVLCNCTALTGITMPENYVSNLPDQVDISVVNIAQRDGYSCATTSLAMVMSYYDNTTYDKKEVWEQSGSSIADVTQKCGNDMDGLARAAAANGFTKYEFISNMKINELKYIVSQNIPVIVNIRNFFRESYHAVVVAGYDQDGFIINDPSGRSYHMDKERFSSHWYAHLCSPFRDEYSHSAFILYNVKK